MRRAERGLTWIQPSMDAKILIVDDDPDTLRLLLHAVNGAGHQAFPAFGGEDAIRKVKAQPFDLVVTDLSMPKVSGVEVIQSIKTDPATQHIPVIAVTAHMWDGISQSALQAGCDGFISKPFSFKQVAEEIAKYLRPSQA